MTAADGWEYVWVWKSMPLVGVGARHDTGDYEQPSHLDVLGAEGWEAVSIQAYKGPWDGHTDDWVLVLLKRPTV